MDPFTNEQIDVTQLPQVETLVYQPLEERYRTVLIISRIIFTLIVTALLTFATLAPFEEKIPQKVIYGLWIFFFLYTIWGFVKTVMGFQHKSYALREKDLIYRSGWLWKDMTTAPFNRVQHVSIDQGPIERKFNLAKLKIYTAGGKASDMSIPGLTPVTANELKEFIVKKTMQENKQTPLQFASDEEQ